MTDTPAELLPGQEAPAQEGVGETLARARSALGLSLEDVAQQLKYSARQIEALEQGRFDRLHGATFARGMVRSYARLVKLDAHPLLERLGDKVAKPAPIVSSVPFRRPIPFSNPARRSTLAYVFLTLVILAVGATVAIEWHQERGPSAPALSLAPTMPNPPQPRHAPAPAASAPAAPAVPSPAPAASSAPPPSLPNGGNATLPPATPAPTAAGTAAAKPLPVTPRPAAGTPGSASSPAVGVAGPPVTETPSTPASSAPPEAPTVGPGTAEHRIVLEFERQSWVEIKDADGKKLLEKLNPAGSRQVVEGKPPFSLVIGNAQHVRVTYDNHAVDLKPYTKVAVARFSLK